MEIAKMEIDAVAQVTELTSQQEFTNLSDMQLSLVGGGCGEVLFG